MENQTNIQNKPKTKKILKYDSRRVQTPFQNGF